jgi:hypothetical protein
LSGHLSSFGFPDGVLSREEYLVGNPNSNDADFDAFDFVSVCVVCVLQFTHVCFNYSTQNKDGHYDKVEYAKRSAILLHALHDKDADGKISLSEFHMLGRSIAFRHLKIRGEL